MKYKEETVQYKLIDRESINITFETPVCLHHGVFIKHNAMEYSKFLDKKLFF